MKTSIGKALAWTQTETRIALLSLSREPNVNVHEDLKYTEVEPISQAPGGSRHPAT